MGLQPKHGRALRGFAAGIGILTAVAGAQPVRADEPVDAAPFHAEARRERRFDSMIDTLIVTGRRTEPPVQQVPVALTRIGTEDLVESNLRRIDDVQKAVPNLVLDQGTGNANSARISLRGLSQNQDVLTSDPVVGIYVDGVYRPRLQASVLTLFDVERIEVLRGPQSTLFGKNSVGGAINITTRKPEFEFGGEANVRFGNFGLVESQLALNVPLMPERAAARLSIATATRDGYVKNVVNDDDYQDNKLLGGRLQLLLTPRPDLEVLLAFEDTVEDRKGFGGKCVLLGPGSGVPALIAGATGFREKCLDDNRRSELKVASDVSFAADNATTLGTSAKISWDITPELTLSSLTSLRRQNFETFFDADSTPVPLIQFENDGGANNESQFSQEFRLTGTGMNGRLSYLAGLYSLKETGSSRQFFGLGFVPVFGSDPNAPPTVAPNPALDQNILKIDTLSWAAYGQLKYSLSEQLDLTLGARLTKDRRRVDSDMRIGACRRGRVGDPCREMNLVGQGSQGPDSFTGFDSTGRFDDISPSASLAYAFNPDFLVYASYSTGFQSGGFNGQAASAEEAQELPNQEVTSYELGIKSTWLENRLTFNATYFYSILQDGTRVAVPQITDNGQLTDSQTLDAQGLVRGAEIEFGVKPLPSLGLRGSIGLTRAELDDFEEGRAAGLENGRLPGIPNVTMNFSLDYQRELDRLGTLGLRTSWSHRGNMNPAIQGTRALQVNKYGLLDGRISLELPDGRTELAAFGTNLLDRRYFFAGFSAEDSFGFGNRFFGPPRFYGVELRRKF